MNIEAENYIFEDSLVRIDKMLGVAMSEQKPSMELPFVKDIPVDRGLCSYCTVMTVRMEIEKCPTVERMKETERFHLCPTEGRYGCQVPKDVWHTVEVIEPSVIYEAKDGKYGEDGSEMYSKV